MSIESPEFLRSFRQNWSVICHLVLCSFSQLTEEVSKMEQRIAQARPLVEEIEAKIRELIHRSGILQQSPT